jgi:hypothetical protein
MVMYVRSIARRLDAGSRNPLNHSKEISSCQTFKINLRTVAMACDGTGLICSFSAANDEPPWHHGLPLSSTCFEVSELKIHPAAMLATRTRCRVNPGLQTPAAKG